jgi:hypothetical protein
MPRYLIERQLPGAGALSASALKDISRTSVRVLAGMDRSLKWVQSYVTADAIYCVYISPNEEMIYEHGRRGGFPVTKITEIVGGIDPTTAEGGPEAT